MLAFTAEHVSRLTGLSLRQLGYWNDIGFFQPHAGGARHRAFGRIYSFRDVVGLRAVAVLRKKHGIPLQELRRVGEQLVKLRDEPWSSIRFLVAGKTVMFKHPDTGETLSTRPFGQQVLAFELEPIANEMREAAKRLAHRDRDQVGKLARNRYVVHNETVVAGTRVPTSAVWNLHDAGYDTKAIIREYPRLRPADVVAALKHEESRRRSSRAG
jgi:DNA-binding transcriptional MerR regulator